jgi:hypothetical protein
VAFFPELKTRRQSGDAGADDQDRFVRHGKAPFMDEEELTNPFSFRFQEASSRSGAELPDDGKPSPGVFYLDSYLFY